MSDKHIFVDTNILVYAHDADAQEKHRLAAARVRSLWDNPYPPAISTQVLHELHVTLSKKGATSSDCRRILSVYLAWEVIESNVTLLMAALEVYERYKLSLWDSLIVAAAHAAKATILWSEDLQTGQNFEGLVVVNPLLE